MGSSLPLGHECLFPLLDLGSFQLQFVQISHVQDAERTPPKLNHDKPTPHHVIVQFANINSKDTELKAARAKKFLTYQGKVMRITSDLSKQTGMRERVGGAFLKHFQRKTCSQGSFIQQGCHSEWMERQRAPGPPKNERICDHQAGPARNIKGGSIKEERPQE